METRANKDEGFRGCVRTEFLAKTWYPTAAFQSRQGRHVIAPHVSAGVSGKVERVPLGRHEFSRTLFSP